jgi:hypothetical protein
VTQHAAASEGGSTRPPSRASLAALVQYTSPPDAFGQGTQAQQAGRAGPAPGRPNKLAGPAQQACRAGVSCGPVTGPSPRLSRRDAAGKPDPTRTTRYGPVPYPVPVAAARDGPETQPRPQSRQSKPGYKLCQAASPSRPYRLQAGEAAGRFCRDVAVLVARLSSGGS